MDLSTVQGPLGLNLKRQLAKLLQATPSSFASQISPLFTQPNATILGALSKFLAAPPLTSLVADLFLPLLVDLCARWLDEQLTEDHFVAICFLVEPHEELYE
jgi:midasin